MPASSADWHPVHKAKSMEEIKQLYKVYKIIRMGRKKSKIWFACKLYREQPHKCQFRVRWNVRSGQVWEAGVHNHGPEEYKEERAEREWHFLAKAHSYEAIRRKYFVCKTGPIIRGSIIRFKCSRKEKEKCSYAMRWNNQTGELFESDAHNHAKLDLGRIINKWHLLIGKTADSLNEICRQYSLKRKGYYSRCAQCNGKKCHFRLRCKPMDGKIFWNKKKLCPRVKEETGNIDENGIEQVDELENQSLQQQHQEIDHNEHENGTPKVEIVGQQLISQDNKSLVLPRMKTETTTASAAAAGSQLHSGNRMQISIDEEEEEMETAAEQQASSQHWRPPHLKLTVKKEEPKEPIAAAAAAAPDRKSVV